jgi:hypothetical protein
MLIRMHSPIFWWQWRSILGGNRTEEAFETRRYKSASNNTITPITEATQIQGLFFLTKLILKWGAVRTITNLNDTKLSLRSGSSKKIWY